MSNAPDFGPEAKALLSEIESIKSAIMPASLRHGLIRQGKLLAAIQAFGAAAYQRGTEAARDAIPMSICEVIAERARQDGKWGEQNHAPDRWLVILGEEHGEACRGALENDGTYRYELVQVAAVAIAAIESFDRARIAARKGPTP